MIVLRVDTSVLPAFFVWRFLSPGACAGLSSPIGVAADGCAAVIALRFPGTMCADLRVVLDSLV